MNSISAIEGGPSCAREAVTGVDPFIPEIVRRILGFLELSPLEEHHLSRVSRAFYSAIASRREEPLKSIEDCIQKIDEVLPKVRGEKLREILRSSKETLTHLNETKESSLSREAKLFRELRGLLEELKKKNVRGDREEEITKFMKMPMMTRAYDEMNKFKEWAESENFLVPLVLFKTLESRPSLFALDFVKALAERGNIEGALQVLPSIQVLESRKVAIFAICQAYLRQGRPQEVVPMAKEFLKEPPQPRVRRAPELERLPLRPIFFEALIDMLEKAQCFDQAREIRALAPKPAVKFL